MGSRWERKNFFSPALKPLLRFIWSRSNLSLRGPPVSSLDLYGFVGPPEFQGCRFVVLEDFVSPHRSGLISDWFRFRSPLVGLGGPESCGYFIRSGLALPRIRIERGFFSASLTPHLLPLGSLDSLSDIRFSMICQLIYMILFGISSKSSEKL